MTIAGSPSGYVNAGSSVTLTCSADGKPQPTVTLYRGADVLVHTGTRPTLQHTVTMIKAFNKLHWYCRAQGNTPSYNRKSSVIQYNVICKYQYQMYLANYNEKRFIQIF